MLESNGMFLLQIQIDGLGLKFKESLCKSQCNSTELSHLASECTRVNKLGFSSASVYILTLTIYKILRNRNRLLQRTRRDNIMATVKCMNKFIRHLEGTNIISGHTEQETQKAISHLSPFIELSFMSCLAAFAVKQETDERKIQCSSSKSWDEINRTLDAVSARIKQAVLMYMFKNYHQSESLLSFLDTSDRLSVCGCDSIRMIEVVRGYVQLINTIIGQNITIEYALKNVFVPCVVFLPEETCLLPNAISYEMIRRFGVPLEARNGTDDFWFDWAVVDAEFLVHFMLCLNHRELRMNPEAVEDVANMEKVIDVKTLSHKESCLNLLGWAYKENGDAKKAVELFCASIKIQPQNNAAYWHLLFCLADRAEL